MSILAKTADGTLMLSTGDILILNFSLASGSSQLDRANADEIKHAHLSLVYVLLDPRYY